MAVLRTICTVVGAVLLYCALTAAMWALVMRAGRRRARLATERRAAAEALARSETRGAVPARRARSRAELPAWLGRDRPWAVAVVLLGAPAVRDRTAPFVDVPNRVIDWAGLLRESAGWPREQRLLVLTAYEMAFDPPGELARELSEPVTLQDVVRHLDDEEVARIRVAMRIRRGRLEPDEALTRLG